MTKPRETKTKKEAPIKVNEIKKTSRRKRIELFKKNNEIAKVNSILNERKKVYGSYMDFRKKLTKFLLHNNYYNLCFEESIDYFFLLFKIVRLESEILNTQPVDYKKTDSYLDIIGYLELFTMNRIKLKRKIEPLQDFTSQVKETISHINTSRL